jgi:hypothetical protein
MIVDRLERSVGLTILNWECFLDGLDYDVLTWGHERFCNTSQLSNMPCFLPAY